MSHFGAKVIYPPTLQPALLKKIPLYIKNTFNPDFEGTYISEERGETEQIITGISSISNISLLTLQGGGLFGVPADVVDGRSSINSLSVMCFDHSHQLRSVQMSA